jgi:hypothetical protein
MLYVDLPTDAELKSLVEERSDACVSIYLPTSAMTQQTDVDRLELRRLGEAALDQLRAKNFDKRRLALLEERIAELGRDHESGDFSPAVSRFWRRRIYYGPSDCHPVSGRPLKSATAFT